MASRICNIPDLLTDKLCLASSIHPFRQKQLSQEWIQWFLLRSQVLVSRGILLLQRTEEPFQHQQGPLSWIFLCRRRNEKRRVLCPVRTVNMIRRCLVVGLFLGFNYLYSVRETPLRMKGGAVREEISPLKEAIDLRKEVPRQTDQRRWIFV